MAQQSWMARYGLLLGGLVALVALVAIPLLLRQLSGTTPTAVATNVEPSKPGWEIRYNATLALARRGSDKVKQRLDVFEEMLNEEQQLRNFTKLPADRHRPDEPARREVVTDAAGAYTTVLTALKALVDCYHQNPKLNLCREDPKLDEALDRLAHSSNPAVRSEVERTRQELAKP